MSSKSVESAAINFWLPEEEKSLCLVHTDMLDTAMTSSAVFSSAMEACLFSSDSEESDLEEGVLRRLRNCRLQEDFSSSVVANAFLSGYLPSSQDNLLQLYQDLHKSGGTENGKKRRNVEAHLSEKVSCKRPHPAVVEKTTSVASATPSLKRAWNRPESSNGQRKKYAVSERNSV